MAITAKIGLYYTSVSQEKSCDSPDSPLLLTLSKGRSMFLLTQNKQKIVNLDSFDYIRLDGLEIDAYIGDKYLILGQYKDLETAARHFSMILNAVDYIGL